MKILFLASASYRGGATFSLINTIIGLKEKGVNIMVVTPEDGYLCKVLSNNYIPYKILPVSLSIWPVIKSLRDIILFLPILFRTLSINFIGYFKLLKFSKNYNPDIIQTNVSVINIGYLVSKKLKIPHVWHVREYGDLDFDMKHFPCKSIFLNRLRESYSISITYNLKEYFNLGKKCKVIYNGIENNHSVEFINDKQNNIIFVGRLSENKGTTILVRTFISFLKRNTKYKLLLIGDYDPKYGNLLINLIKNHNASAHIKLLGGRTDVFDIMNKSKAIIVPSRCEGFGRITAEAMFNNCLVIGRNTGGTKEQFDNGIKIAGEEIGLRFNNASELLERLYDLDKMGTSTYANMVIKAKEVATSLYNTKNNIIQTYQFMNNILLQKES